ncbi:MAG: IS1595 family transposase [Chthoniobacter sp.]|uniref:IS1595 family transposase n=1 Tax=Chthoniobacter sp. TaxID=2510640 RepID=UPI0032AE0E48
MKTRSRKPRTCNIPKKAEINLVNLIEQFGSNEKCRQRLTELRWPNGVECPRCASKSISTVFDRDQYDCNGCRYQFSATSGTIFHDTHLSLAKWFLAIYLMTESKKGMSALQIKRTLNIAYQTAWHLCHRIRHAMRDANCELLKGIVEVDETYVGGKTRGTGHGYKGNKAIAIGAVQRGGKIRLQIIQHADKATLHKFIADNTAPDTEAIYTDSLPAYNGVADEDTRHESVNHRAEEWVRGDVHTNGIESVWSLLKRSIVGSFHHVSMKHLDAYLDELEHRFNNRSNEFIFRDTLTKLVKAGALPYSELVRAA